MSEQVRTNEPLGDEPVLTKETEEVLELYRRGEKVFVLYNSKEMAERELNCDSQMRAIIEKERDGVTRNIAEQVEKEGLSQVSLRLREQPRLFGFQDLWEGSEEENRLFQPLDGLAAVSDQGCKIETGVFGFSVYFQDESKLPGPKEDPFLPLLMRSKYRKPGDLSFTIRFDPEKQNDGNVVFKPFWVLLENRGTRDSTIIGGSEEMEKFFSTEQIDTIQRQGVALLKAYCKQDCYLFYPFVVDAKGGVIPSESNNTSFRMSAYLKAGEAQVGKRLNYYDL